MQKLMLGFAGEMAAGKGTATDLVKEWFPGTGSFRYSDSLREFYALLVEKIHQCGEVVFVGHIYYFLEGKLPVHLLMIEQMVRSAFGPRIAIRGIGEGPSPLVPFCQWLVQDFIPVHKGKWTPLASTPDLQAISTAVRGMFGEETLECAIMSRVCVSESESPVVIIEGIRRLVDIRTFLGDQSIPFRLTYIKADPYVRYLRHKKRGEKPGDSDLTFEQFLALGEQEAEQQIRLLEPYAHLVIDNTHDKEFPKARLRAPVETWLREPR